MILFTIKLLSSLRKAIAGRKHPSQLAWGLAFGLLLGLIPHGNLLAVILVLGVLMLRVNHAAVALTAIGVTFVAPKLDPVSDQFAQWFFSHQGVSNFMAKAWDYPLVPWTDLNNTVVMGSFLIGLIALVPTFAITYPLIRAWAGVGKASNDAERKDEVVIAVKRQRIDEGHPAAMPAPAARRSQEPFDRPVASSGRVYDVRRIDDGEAVMATITPSQREPLSTSPAAHHATRIELVEEDDNAAVATLEKARTANRTETTTQSSIKTRQPAADDQHKIDEALSYLLRQLRDSQDKDAA